MRQKGNYEFIESSKNWHIRGENKNLLISRFIDKSHHDYPLETIHIYAENAPVGEHNKAMLERLETPLFQINAIDEHPTESELSNTDISWIKNSKLSETGGLAYELNLKVGARINDNKIY